MNKKVNTLLFILGATIANIVIMAILFLFMGLLIAVVHFGIKLLNRLPKKEAAK